MMKKNMMTMVSVCVCCILMSSLSFALDIPDGFARDAAVSDAALGAAKQQFALLKQQLEAMLPSLAPDQQAAVNQAIVVVDDKLARLGTVDVYFCQEATPGERYDEVKAFYQGTLQLVQDISNDEVVFALMNMPPGMIPQETLDTLTPLVNQGKVRAASGIADGGRVGISTVYVHPQTLEVIEGTTIVVAKDK